MSTRLITHEIIERKTGDLFADPNVQRAVRKLHVDNIVKEFDPAALGVLTTSYRGPDSIHLVDGQHRWLAAIKVGYQGALTTMEYRGLTIPEEAALFRKLNYANKPSAIDKFLLSCVEQNPDSLRLARYLEEHGWTLAAFNGNGKLSAIGSLERVYRDSPTAADGALAVITAAWGHRPAAVNGPILEGIGVMIAHYEGIVDLNLLAKKLSTYQGGPEALGGYAKGQKAARGGNMFKHVALTVTDVYNAGLRSRKLPAWT